MNIDYSPKKHTDLADDLCDYTQISVGEHMDLVDAMCDSLYRIEDGQIIEILTGKPLPLDYQTIICIRRLGFVEIACHLYGYRMCGEVYAILRSLTTDRPADIGNIGIGNAGYDLDVLNDNHAPFPDDMDEDEIDALEVSHIRPLTAVLAEYQ